MPRLCSVCHHPDRAAIDAALVAGEPYRSIAQRFAASSDAVLRHKLAGHLPAALVKAQDAQEVTQADDLLAQLRALRSKSYGLLLAAERAGDIRTALAGVREARACLELLAELEGELDRRPVVNLLIAPEWLSVRAALFVALAPYPEARAAVADRLLALEPS